VRPRRPTFSLQLSKRLLRIEIAVEGMKNENLPMQETKVLKILLSYTDAVVPTQQPKMPSSSILMPCVTKVTRISRFCNEKE
jgi:hypothetical protein